MTLNEETIKVSVVIPVYNAGPYISRCIDSLKSQTMKELEFIFVDDCSKDKSMEWVVEWAAIDHRVKILRNGQNLGEGGSRNRGIEAAQGTYINTIDPDDWVAPDYYELLYKKAAQTGADIVKGTRIKIKEGSMEEIKPRSKLNVILESRLAKGEPLYLYLHYEHQTVLFRKSILNGNIRYGESANAADTTFLLRLCTNVGLYASENKACYYYLQRKGSATSEYSLNRSKNELISLGELFSHLLQEGQINSYAYKYCLLLGYHVYAMRFIYAYENGKVSAEDKAQYISELKTLFMLIPDYKIFYELVPEMYALIELEKLLTKELCENIEICREEVSDWMSYVCALDAEKKRDAAKKLGRLLTEYLKKRRASGITQKKLKKEIAQMSSEIEGIKKKIAFRAIVKEALEELDKPSGE